MSSYSVDAASKSTNDNNTTGMMDDKNDNTCKKRLRNQSEPDCKKSSQKQQKKQQEQQQQQSHDSMLQQRVAKYFQFLYKGIIVATKEENKNFPHQKTKWLVKYDDGDSEYMDLKQIQKAILLFQQQSYMPNESSSAAEAAEPPPPQFQLANQLNNIKPRLQQHVARYFHVLYKGTIVSSSKQDGSTIETLWHIQYDDGDAEDMNLEEVQKAMKLFQKEFPKAITKVSSSTTTTVAAEVSTSNQAPCKKRKTDYITQLAEYKTRFEKTTMDHDVTTTSSVSSSSSSSSSSIQKLMMEKKTFDDFPYKGARVAKFFNHTLFYGYVINCFLDEENTYIISRHDSSKKNIEFVPTYIWRVKYSDGNTEDYNLKELYDILNLYQQRRGCSKDKNDPNHSKEEGITENNKINNKISHNGSVINTPNGQYWEVEQILDQRYKKMNGGVEVAQYLIKWKNYNGQNDWVCAEQLDENSLAEAWMKFPPSENFNELKGEGTCNIKDIQDGTQPSKTLDSCEVDNVKATTIDQNDESAVVCASNDKIKDTSKEIMDPAKETTDVKKFFPIDEETRSSANESILDITASISSNKSDDSEAEMSNVVEQCSSEESLMTKGSSSSNPDSERHSNMVDLTSNGSSYDRVGTLLYETIYFDD